jgi:hypothetical protein
LVERFERLGIKWADLQAGGPQDPLDWLRRLTEIRQEHEGRIGKFAQDTRERVREQKALDEFYADIENIGGRRLGPQFQQMIRTMTPERLDTLFAGIQRMQEAYGEALPTGADRARGEQAFENAAKFSDAMFLFEQALGKITTKIGGAVMPELANVFDELTNKLLEIGPALAKVGAVFITGGWQAITTAMQAVDLTKWSELFKDIAGVPSLDAKNIGESIGAFISDLPDALRSAASAVNSLVEALGGLAGVAQWFSNPAGKAADSLNNFGNEALQSTNLLEKAGGLVAKGLGHIVENAIAPELRITRPVEAIAAPPTVAAGGEMAALAQALAQPTTQANWEQAAANLQTGVETGGQNAGWSLGEAIATGGSTMASALVSGAGTARDTIVGGFQSGAALFSGIGSAIGAEAAAAFRAGVAGLSIAGPSPVGATSAAAPAATGLSEP